MHGWNIHNEPIICTYFVSQFNKSALIDTHTSEYVPALESMFDGTKKIAVSVRSILTDNATNNVTKMRTY